MLPEICGEYVKDFIPLILFGCKLFNSNFAAGGQLQEGQAGITTFCCNNFAWNTIPRRNPTTINIM
jgi:hypothetical protein